MSRSDEWSWGGYFGSSCRKTLSQPFHPLPEFIDRHLDVLILAIVQAQAQGGCIGMVAGCIEGVVHRLLK